MSAFLNLIIHSLAMASLGFSLASLWDGAGKLAAWLADHME